MIKHNVFILISFIERFYKLQFAGSRLQYLWSFITPLLLSFAIFFVFKNVFNITQNNFALIIFSGYLPWIFISGCISKGHRLIIENRSFFKNLQGSRIHFIIGFMCFQFILAIPSFLLLIILSVILMPLSLIKIILFIITLIFLLIFLTGLVFVLASWTVFYPDLSHSIETLLLFLLWLSPVFYLTEALPEPLKNLTFFNPMAWSINLIRFSLNLTVDINPFLTVFLLALVSVFFLFFGTSYFLKHKNEILKFL